MRRAGFWPSFITAIVSLLLTTGARAQSADPNSSGAAHAWLVLPDPATEGSVLVHVPPRRAAEGAAFLASERGTLRVARRLATAPRSIGAWGDDVYLLMPETPERPARVLTLTAFPPPIGDLWSYEPRTRLRPLDPLPDQFTAQSIVGARSGPAVLGAKSGRDSLIRFSEGAWAEIPLPEGAQGSELHLLPDSSGRIQILSIAQAGGATLWTMSEQAWVSNALSQDIQPGRLIASAVSGSRVLLARRSDNAIELLALTESGAEGIASTVATGEQLAAAFQGDHFEVLVLAWEDSDAGPGAPSVQVRLAELSTTTGRELYRGPAIRTLPVSATQFRLLAATLIALMGVVLLVVLKPSEEGEIQLPPGFSLAEPARRLAATMIDLLIAVFIVRVIFDVPLIEIITLAGLIRPGGAWLAAPSMLAIGFLLSFTGEWLFGRSLGKLATGCRVVGIRPPTDRPVRPAFWRAAVRNIVKWALPPVAALALVDPSARHRGDSISGLAVVVPTHGSPAEPGEDA